MWCTVCSSHWRSSAHCGVRFVRLGGMAVHSRESARIPRASAGDGWHRETNVYRLTRALTRSGWPVGRFYGLSKGGVLLDDAQLDHECNGWHDQATRRSLYLDASQHRPDVSLSADLP